MNFFVALIVAISAWMTFSVLNELAMAKGGKGCCESKDCGEGHIATSLWWMNLVVAVLFTGYVLFQLYEEYKNVRTGGASSLLSKNPFKRGVKMVFGD